jgi:hypothetical protein
MYAKLINGVFVAAPKKLSVHDTIVYNPPDDMYSAVGYKPVVFTEHPDEPDGYIYKSGWNDENDVIVQIWTLMPLPNDIDEDEAYRIIFGGEVQ